MSVSAWAFARRPRFPAVQDARFSYGSCTPTPELGVASKCSQAGGHFVRIYARFSFERTPLPCCTTKPESLYTPNDAKTVPGTKRPCETPHRCGPLREVFSGVFLVHTIRRRWRRSLPPKPRNEVNDLTRTLKTRPDPKAPRQSLVPAPKPTGKNATFERGTCHSGALGPVARMPLPATTDATPVWKIPASPGVHSRGPVEGDFPPFQLRNS